MFEQDKYLALIQGAVNLVVSILLVQRVGLIGVYVGTIVSGLIANVTKPVIIYRVILDKPVREYFTDSVKYILALLFTFVLLSGVKKYVMRSVTVFTFAAMFVVICLVFNGIFLALFGRTKEFEYLRDLVRGKLGGRLKRKK